MRERFIDVESPVSEPTCAPIIHRHQHPTCAHKSRVARAVHRRGVAGLRTDMCADHSSASIPHLRTIISLRSSGSSTWESPVSEPTCAPIIHRHQHLTCAHKSRVARAVHRRGVRRQNNREGEYPPYYFGAGSRSRTGTVLSYHGILSPGRLPIPPFRHIVAT